jgi:hypothetical protein
MAFYATIDADSVRSDMPTVPYLLPASSWARYNTRSVRLPRRLRHVAADGGGFVATRIWGDYRYSPQQYVSWLHTFRPESAAAVAYCCEDEIGDNGLGEGGSRKPAGLMWPQTGKRACVNTTMARSATAAAIRCSREALTAARSRPGETQSRCSTSQG